MTSLIDHAPLAASLAELSRLSSYINVQIGQPVAGGWVRVEQLLAPESPQLATLLGQIATHYETSDRRFIGMTAFNHLLWQLSAVAIGGSLGFARVPDLQPANIAMRFNEEGWPAAVAVLDGRFVALSSDPEAGHPDVAVVESFPALRQSYLSRLRDELAPRLIESLRPHSPLGERTFWSALADQMLGMALWLGKELGSADTAASEAESLAAAVPQAQKSGIFWVEWQGRREPFLKRGSCCYTYKLPGRPYCASCPLQSVGERTRRFQESMAEA